MKNFYLDLTKKWLMNLNAYKENLNILEILREEIMVDSPIDYERERLSPTHKIYLDTEEKAIKLYEIERYIKSLNNKINTIEKNLNELKEINRQVLILRYCESWKVKDIAIKYNYDYYHTSKLIKKSLHILKDTMFDILIE